MPTQEKSSKPSGGNEKAVPDEEVRQESSQAAKQALAYQKKANELKDAASAAGDPDERQKLMERAIDEQVKAESFGKTAKYMRTGTFQGMAVGTGLGVAPGASLGALTGTLVGGVTSTITGGLGAGVGALTGAIHGPFVNLGQMAGKGIRKITGDLPGWVASDEQKKTLEKMIGQISEQDMPDKEELEKMGADAKEGAQGAGGWIQSAKNMMPSMGSTSESQNGSQEQEKKEDKSSSEKQQQSNSGAKSEDTSANTEQRKKPRKLETRSAGAGNKAAEETPAPKKAPRKLEVKSESGGTQQQQQGKTDGQKKPRKLEKRTS